MVIIYVACVRCILRAVQSHMIISQKGMRIVIVTCLSLQLSFQTGVWKYGNGNPAYVVPRPYKTGKKHGEHNSLIIDQASTAVVNATHILQTPDDSSMCSAAKIENSLQDVVTVPVPCNKKLKTQMVCQQTVIPRYNGCLKEHSRNHDLLLTSYNKNSRALMLSSRICPPGYNVYWPESHKCIKHVHPRNTDDAFNNCSQQYPTSDMCDNRWDMEKCPTDSPHYQLEETINTLCRNDNANASALKEKDEPI